MVAFFGFGALVQIRVEVFLVAEGNAVDALQHLVVAVAAPIRARNAGQLKAILRDLSGMGEVRPPAEVLPIAVPVHAQRLIAGNAVDEFDFVRLVVVFVVLDGAITFPDLGADRVFRADDLAHLLFDLFEVFGGEGLFAVEVVIEAVFDDRPDGNFGVGPDLLDRPRHDMRAVVADQLKGVRGHLVVFGGDDGEIDIFRQRLRQIGQITVHGHGQRHF